MVRPRHVTDEVLLAVARDCFIQHGPGVSTTVIAEAAGVSQATLFKRFGTKHELMVAALAPKVAPSMMARLAAGPSDAPMPEQLLDMALEMHALFETLLPCVMAMWAAGTPSGKVFEDPANAPPVLARKALTRWFAQAQEQGRLAGGSPEALALLLFGAVKELTFQRNLFQEHAPAVEPEAYLRTVVDAIWAGCAPPEAP